MVTLENLVNGFLPSSSSGLARSSSNQAPDQGRSVSKIVHPFPSPLADTRSIIQHAFSDRLQGPPLLSPTREDAGWVSDLPVVGGVGFEDGSGTFSTASAASSEAMVWVVGWSWEQVVGVVLVAVIVPFIVVSNLLVVVSVARFKRLQLPTNYFIVSLAAVDMGVALLTPSFIVMELLPGQEVSPVLCLSPNRVLMTACGVSVLTMAAIAYDRHTALVSPLKYVSVMTPRKIALLLTSVCLYSATIVWLPLLLGWFSSSAQDGDTGGGNALPCSFQLLQDRAHVLFLGAIFGPACLAITVCYFRIYTVARQHARAIAAMESSVQHNLRARIMIRDAKYAKTLALVIGAFLLLWAPYLFCLLAQVIVPSVRVSPWLWNYLTLLAVLNSGLNPWIYAFKNNDFRTAFGRILRACCGACCPVGGGMSCCGIFKDSRRSNSLSGVNIFTTMATSACQSRSNQGSGAGCGRLSDVSYVISVGGMDSDGKIFNANRRHSLASRRRHSLSSCRRHSVASYRHSLLNHRNSLTDYRSSLVNHRDSLKIHRSSLPNHRQSLSASVPATGTTLRSAAQSTESGVSTLLNVDSRAFIKDLLNLYLHHSLLHSHADADSESGEVEDAELGDQPDPGHPGYRSDRTDQTCPGDHSDHSRQWAQSRHGYINCVYQSDSTENTYSYHTEHTYHSDHTEDACSSSHANHPSHSSHAFQSEHADDSCYSDYSDHSYHGDDTDHCNHGDPTDSSHQGKPCDYSYQSACTHHTSHGDGADSVHRHSKENKESVCKTDVSKQCIIELTQDGDHGDHTDRGYHSDHSDHVKHSI